MADNPIPQYPYMFSPDQFKNQYSKFAGVALPWPPKVVGVPTDALGRQIGASPAPTMGTTINSQPPAAAPQSAAQQLALNYLLTQHDVLGDQMAAARANTGGMGPAYTGTAAIPGAAALQNSLQQQRAAVLPYIQQAARSGGSALDTIHAMQGAWGQLANAQAAPAASAAPAVASAAGAPGQLSYDDYLGRLSNPGPVTTPGATVAQAPPPSAQSSVMQAFLNNWKAKGAPTQGAGNYNNQGFYDALQGAIV